MCILLEVFKVSGQFILWTTIVVYDSWQYTAKVCFDLSVALVKQEKELDYKGGDYRIDIGSLKNLKM